MEFSLETAVVGSAIAMAVIAASFAYLYILFRDAHELGWWAAAYLFITVDYVMVLAAPTLLTGSGTFGVVLLPLWEGVHGGFVICLLVGVNRFLGRPNRTWVLSGLLAVMVAWGVIGALTPLSHLERTLPGSLIAGGLVAYAGYLLFRRQASRDQPGHMFAGTACLLWGLHRLDYSLIDRFPALLPYGYMIAQTLALAMGIGLILTSLEFNRRRAAASEAEAQRARDRVAAILEAVPAAVVVADRHGGELLYANARFADLLGHPPDEGALSLPPGTVLRTALPPAEGRGEPRRDALGLPGTLAVYEYRARRAAGDPIWVLEAERPIDWHGRPAVQSTILDVTPRKLAEAELKAAKSEAERANRAKTKFLASASHDLRQPLQALNLFTATLADRETDPENARLIRQIADSLDALERLLNALLDISKLEAGLVVSDVHDVALGRMIRRLHDEFEPIARNKGLVLRCVPTEAVVRTDPVLIETALRNLVSNAVKYTDRGKILLGCRRHGGQVRIEVLDTGRGIPKDQITTIFDDFRQLAPAPSGGQTGFGLGLSIVDRLTRLLGHKLVVRSEPGKGSLFSIEVPATEIAAAPIRHPGPAPAALPRGMDVVVIDDEPEVRTGLTAILTAWGCRVTALSGLPGPGRDAVNHEWRTLMQRGRAPDLVVADLRLRDYDEDGAEAVRMLRERFGAPIPAVLLTGDISPDRLKNVERDGLPVLHKPVRPDRLRAALASLVEATRPNDGSKA